MKAAAATAAPLAPVVVRRPTLRSLGQIVAALTPKPGESAEALLKRVQAEATRAEWTAIQRAAVLRSVHDLQRRHVADIENRAGKLIDGGDMPEPSERRQAFAGLLVEHIWLPDGSTVAWGEATAEQHRQRAAHLRGQASTLSAKAQRHEDAADLIERSGVSCLDEIVVAS